MSSPLGASGASVPYTAPSWAPEPLVAPKQRLLLAHLPTPLHSWPLPRVPDGTEVWIKRDDCTGCELSGNKVRKLEFLLAEALEQGCDSVITVGGIQSNHCRATAAAARRVGLEPHIILRAPAEAPPPLEGNLLVDRLVGAQIHEVSEARFAAKGGWRLVQDLKEDLEAEGKRPYAFPSGGSNALGTWGYLQLVAELEEQVRAAGMPPFDRIYFACGSGGTAAGLAAGVHYSGMGEATELVGLGVDDSPEFFYDKISAILRGAHSDFTDLDVRKLLRLEDRVGEGYAVATDEELRFVCEAARATGVCLDPVYSGKGALGMVADLRERPGAKRVLFVHTGGLLGLYAKAAQLEPLVMASG